eukprot:3169922-Rhodomonas_salina.5
MAMLYNHRIIERGVTQGTTKMRAMRAKKTAIWKPLAHSAMPQYLTSRAARGEDERGEATPMVMGTDSW